MGQPLSFHSALGARGVVPFMVRVRNAEVASVRVGQGACPPGLPAIACGVTGTAFASWDA